MLTYIIGVAILVLLIRHFRKASVYNPYDQTYANSSYDKLMWSREPQSEELFRIVDAMAGHKRILRSQMIADESGRSICTDLLLIHESGIYVFDLCRMAGYLKGTIRDRYWTMYIQTGANMSVNYLYNPFLRNHQVLDVVRWKCRDRMNLLCNSIAVYEKAVFTEITDEQEHFYTVSLSGLAMKLADLMNHSRTYLKPSDVDDLAEQILAGSERGE